MIEQQRQRIEQEMTKMVDEIDKLFLRKMQAKMHYCAAKCCEETSSSLSAVQNCVERCSQPVQQAQTFVQNELEQYQQRLQRCVMQCNDDIKIKMPSNASEEDIRKFTDQFERCAVQCVDKSISQIPQLMKNIKTVLSKGDIPYV